MSHSEGMLVVINAWDDESCHIKQLESDVLLVAIYVWVFTL